MAWNETLKIALILLSLIAIVLLLMPDQNSKEPDSQIPDLASVFQSSDNNLFQETLAKLLIQLRDRNHVMDYISLGDFLIKYGHCEHASMFFQRATQKDSQLYDSHIGYAVCLDQLGYNKSAINAYNIANEHAEETYQIMENKQRIGELHLRIGEINTAKDIFQQLKKQQYQPAMVKLCRIYVHDGNWQQALDAFEAIHSMDKTNESLEVYQLNALAKRHFNKHFSSINSTRHRELIYSDNIPLLMRKTMAEHMFHLDSQDLYKDTIKKLPAIIHQTQFFSNKDLYLASSNEKIIKSGEHIYRTNNCIICHGLHAYGATGVNLRDDYWLINEPSPSKLFITITDGRANNTMPGYGRHLTPNQIRDVTAYIIYLHRETTQSADGSTTNGKDKQGQRSDLYIE
ncbi:MAG: c-type cytochrome [Planctomycetes bacterium]|nr:c-type cytochrome [Planctomycetota bacterium]